MVVNIESNALQKNFNTMGIFNECYFNLNFVTASAIKYFTKLAAVRFYYNLIKSEKFLKGLYMKYTVDANTIVFWTVVDPNNFESRDKIYDYELELYSKFKDYDVNFEFNILFNSEPFLTKIPKSAVNVLNE
jgi:hypothetical protein